MNNKTNLFLSQFQYYWIFRKILLKIIFFIEKFLFRIGYNLKNWKNSSRTLSFICVSTLKLVILAGIVATFLQYIDPYLTPLFKGVGLEIPNDSDYVTFLAAISSIGSVFIGLYFTAISSVGGAIYARVPNNVRSLLAKERLGSVYMGFLSFLTFLCIVLIGLRISNFNRIILAVPLITFFAGIGIFAFVQLGQRAFNLFDPTELSHYLFEEMGRWLKTVETGGFQWANNKFQHLAYKNVSSAIDTLETLVAITEKEAHLNGMPFVDLSTNALRFLIYYGQCKNKIPTESYWYQQKYVHRDWYRTDDSQVSIAHQTGTSIQPLITRDHEWVEKRLFLIVTKCIEVNLQESRYSEVLGLLESIDIYLKSISKEGQVSRAYYHLEILSKVILQGLMSASNKNTNEGEELDKLAVIERLASIPISLALEYEKALASINRKLIDIKLSEVQWRDIGSIYNSDFPTYCLSRLEWLRPRLIFELAAEDREITPTWYQLELILQIEVEQLSSNIESLISKGAGFFANLAKQSIEHNHFWLAAGVMSREWEYWHKINHQTDLWTSKWNELSDYRKVEGLPWPQFDENDLRSKVNLRRNELLTTMSKQNTLLSLISRQEGFPDYAGQFLHISGEAALDALLSNNASLFKNIFTPYLFGCMVRFEKLRPTSGTVDWQTQQNLKIAAAALLDLMDISGYAKLFSDFHGNDELWNAVTDAWDEFLKNKSYQSPLPLLSAVIQITDTAFELPHRGILRTTWQQKINWELRKVPRHDEYSKDRIIPETVIDHDSPLVRVFAQEPYGSFNDGVDIFIATYLCNFSTPETLDFGWKRRDLQSSIEREKRDKARRDVQGINRE